MTQPPENMNDTERGEDSEAAAEAARRLEHFTRAGDPAALWPGLTEIARVSASRELARVTRLVLAGSTAVRVDPSGARDPYALAIAAHTTGMGPVLGRWAEDGLVDGAPLVLRHLATHLAHARRRAERMEREVIPALDALAARGITATVLKGLHTGRVYFEEPGVRRMADIDVVVSPDVVDDAEAALRDAGFRPANAAMRPYKREWIGPLVEERVFSVELAHERGPWTLELHASLDRVYHRGAVAKLDSQASCVEPFEFAGRPLLVLGQPLLLISLACHCSQELHGARLLRLVEMVRVIRADEKAGRLDWDALIAMLRRTGAARFTYPALALVEDLAPGSVDARVLAIGRRESTWTARHTVERLHPAGGSLDDMGVLRGLMWATGPVSWLQRAIRSVWPASVREFRDAEKLWRVQLRRLRGGTMSLLAPDERRALTQDRRDVRQAAPDPAATQPRAAAPRQPLPFPPRERGR